MKQVCFLFVVFFLSSCLSCNQDNRIVRNVESVLPGTWEILKLNNLASVDDNLTEVYYETGNSIANFGRFYFPPFDLEFTDYNTIMSETINFEFERDSIKYPLRIINENIIRVNEIDYLQLDVVPSSRRQFKNKISNIENMIDDLNLFHTRYIIEIESDNQIRLTTSSTREEISFDLLRVK